MDKDRITLADFVAAGYCASGVRRWFSENKMDFRAFVKNGATADEVLAFGGAMGKRVVERKKKSDGR